MDDNSVSVILGELEDKTAGIMLVVGPSPGPTTIALLGKAAAWKLVGDLLGAIVQLKLGTDSALAGAADARDWVRWTARYNLGD